MLSVDCPKCLRSLWTATGRFGENRFGRRRAELKCTSCGYTWSSGLSAALVAGELAAARQEPGPRNGDKPKPKATGPGPLADLVRDWKIKQAGERE